MRLSFILILMTGVLLMDMPNLWAQEPNGKSIATELTVGSGKWQVGRLSNVPARAQVHIEVAAQREIMFMILDEFEIKQFPKVKEPIALMKLQQRLSLNTIIQEAGNYYLLFWNKKQPHPVSVKFFARVEAGNEFR